MQEKEIRIRPIEKRDLLNLNKWKNDKDTFQFLGGGFHPISIDEQEKWLDRLIDMTGENRRFIIEKVTIENKEEKNIAIGLVGLYTINWIHRTCEVGIFIGEKNEQNKGYAKLAYQIIEEYAVKYLNLRKINLKVVSINQNAILLWKSLGFQKVGELHKERYINGKYFNVDIMEKFINN